MLGESLSVHVATFGHVFSADVYVHDKTQAGSDKRRVPYDSPSSEEMTFFFEVRGQVWGRRCGVTCRSYLLAGWESGWEWASGIYIA